MLTKERILLLFPFASWAWKVFQSDVGEQSSRLEGIYWGTSTNYRREHSPDCDSSRHPDETLIEDLMKETCLPVCAHNPVPRFLADAGCATQSGF